jgi:RNA polymerase-interacting CarD/CdnL/TRCF family regulator
MTDDLNGLKRNDVIIRFGIVNKITKLEKIEDSSGKKDKVIYFEPIYKTRSNETLKLSIPLSNIDKTTIRLPVSKAVLNDELKFLRQGDYERIQFNQLKVKRIISTNELHEIAQVLKTLWEEKRDEDKNFTISKRNTFGMVMMRFQQEVAHALGLKLEDAEKKVESALDTGWNRQLKLRANKKPASED